MMKGSDISMRYYKECAQENVDWDLERVLNRWMDELKRSPSGAGLVFTDTQLGWVIRKRRDASSSPSFTEPEEVMGCWIGKEVL